MVLRSVLPLESTTVTLRVFMKTLHLLFAIVLATLVGCASHNQETRADKKIKVLVLTGGHGFKAEPFFKMFADNPEITFTNAAQGKSAEAYEREVGLVARRVEVHEASQELGRGVAGPVHARKAGTSSRSAR